MDLARRIFGDTIDYTRVRLRRRKWFPFQPLNLVMAPWGHIHFHPSGPSYCDDFSAQPPHFQGFFIHELTHVWQAQRKGWWYLPLVRPFSRRYDYTLVPGKPLADYGIEQQAEILGHAARLMLGSPVAGKGELQHYLPLLPGKGIPHAA